MIGNSKDFVCHHIRIAEESRILHLHANAKGCLLTAYNSSRKSLCRVYNVNNKNDKRKTNQLKENTSKHFAL